MEPTSRNSPGFTVFASVTTHEREQGSLPFHRLSNASSPNGLTWISYEKRGGRQKNKTMKVTALVLTDIRIQKHRMMMQVELTDTRRQKHRTMMQVDVHLGSDESTFGWPMPTSRADTHAAKQSVSSRCTVNICIQPGSITASIIEEEL